MSRTTVTLEARDTAGNIATRDVVIFVPHDQGKAKKGALQCSVTVSPAQVVESCPFSML